MNNYVIRKLKEGRANAKLKQSDVASKIGIKPNTLSNYENGVSEPDIDTFCALCDIYNLNPSDILNEAYGLSVQGSNFTIKPSEIKHIEKYRQLDQHGKEMTDFVLNKEYDRCQAIQQEKVTTLSKNPTFEHPVPTAAHADDYIHAPDDLKQLEEDIMDDENF